MALTEKIILEVDSETAKLWQEAGEQERLKLKIRFQLGLLSNSKSTSDNASNVGKELERLHQKAVENGMDEKIQQSLLDELAKI